ncbi:MULTISPECIES: ribosome-associated translation inhibitor RaiA [unclassified Spirosoma]|uniref:ribosome hibernation-promoting factor, HPF/YfiA family n=1 Tax=unclassified Spirosoma TaxID=2621999 RepID=UPI000965DB2B|nr:MULTISPECIES: ribosome-associated translation inhibitor RaiA [unclassified Spirosoma]MBN8821660.1 ribosome-associated translation inhibitor RaiA [Spirosoma sp.]OJW80843.1 MAG: ribosomal subunit interface protein [Spirosoma sp. 48-14]
MQQDQSLDNVRMDIEAVGFTLTDDLRVSVLDSLSKLQRFYKGDVITADVYLKVEPNQRSNEKHVGIKYGVPGNDVYADESGDNWYALIHSVVGKLQRQLEKRFGNHTNANRANLDEIDPASLV